MIRIIFAVGNGITRAPMATEIFKELYGNDDAEVLCRGVTVAFPEPLNQKAEAVLAANGIKLEEFTARQLEEEDYTADTYVFTMDEKDLKRIKKRIETADDTNTFVLSSYLGDELEILDPYGGPLQTYGLCFEVLKTSIARMIEKMRADGILKE